MVQQQQRQNHGEGIELKNLKEDQYLKYVMVGDMGVGKSSLMHRFTANTFTQGLDATMGLEIHWQKLVLNRNYLKMCITSTVGHRSQSRCVGLRCQHAEGVMLVYDVTDRATFSNLPYWIEKVVRPGTGDNNTRAVITLVGNKTDRPDQRVVSTQEGRDFAKRHGFLFVETSPKSADNVQAAFEQNAKEVLRRIQRGSLVLQKKREEKNRAPEFPGSERDKISIWNKIRMYFAKIFKLKTEEDNYWNH